MNDTLRVRDTRPTVSDILRASGVRPIDVINAAPDLSPHTVRAIFLGRTSGTTHATALAGVMGALAKEHQEAAEQYSTAAQAITQHYPPLPPVERPEPPLSAVTEHIVWQVENGTNLAEASKKHGITREAGRQRVKTHEKRTGKPLPRYGR